MEKKQKIDGKYMKIYTLLHHNSLILGAKDIGMGN